MNGVAASYGSRRDGKNAVDEKSIGTPKDPRLSSPFYQNARVYAYRDSIFPFLFVVFDSCRHSVYVFLGTKLMNILRLAPLLLWHLHHPILKVLLVNLPH